MVLAAERIGATVSAEENKEVVRRLVRAVNEGALDELGEILAPDYVRHDPNPLLEDAGIEKYREAFSRLRTAFPDARWTVEEMLADGDRVILRGSFKGTHEGPFFNVPPTGRVVRYPILAIYRIEDGKIAEDWHMFHSIGLWQELLPEVRELIDRATQETPPEDA
jgi:steroid delta-isomerase-like uncharacterized protein